MDKDVVNEFAHLFTSITIVAAIVVLTVTGHNDPEIVVPFLTILGGQIGYKFGAKSNEAKNV